MCSTSEEPPDAISNLMIVEIVEIWSTMLACHTGGVSHVSTQATSPEIYLPRNENWLLNGITTIVKRSL